MSPLSLGGLFGEGVTEWCLIHIFSFYQYKGAEFADLKYILSLDQCMMKWWKSIAIRLMSRSVNVGVINISQPTKSHGKTRSKESVVLFLEDIKGKDNGGRRNDSNYNHTVKFTVYHSYLTFRMKVHSFLLEQSKKQNKQRKRKLISNSNRHKPQR